MKIRRGFTILELVIIIAVIGILAAVLVPTFTTVVRKQNIAYDQALADNINTILTASFSFDPTLCVTDTVKKLRDSGVDSLAMRHKKDVAVFDLSKNKAVIFSDLTVFKEEEQTKISSNLCEPERIFTGYIILSDSGNALSEAVSAVRNIDSNTNLQKEVFDKTADVEEEFGLSGLTDAYKSYVCSTYFIGAEGVCYAVNPLDFSVVDAQSAEFDLSNIANVCFTPVANKLTGSTLGRYSKISALCFPYTLTQIDFNALSHTTLAFYSFSHYLSTAVKTQATDALRGLGASSLKSIIGHGAQITPFADAPNEANGLVYNQANQYGFASNNAIVVREGTGYSVNAGVFTAELELREGYSWSDGTVGVKYLAWSIDKALPVLQHSPEAQPLADGAALSSSVITGELPLGAGTPSAEVAGTFEWQNPAQTVTIEDNGAFFSALFVPTDSVNYQTLLFRIPVIVE